MSLHSLRIWWSCKTVHIRDPEGAGLTPLTNIERRLVIIYIYIYNALLAVMAENITPSRQTGRLTSTEPQLYDRNINIKNGVF
jgi:hypothetical protein